MEECRVIRIFVILICSNPVPILITWWWYIRSPPTSSSTTLWNKQQQHFCYNELTALNYYYYMYLPKMTCHFCFCSFGWHGWLVPKELASHHLLWIKWRQLLAIESYTESHRTIAVTADISSTYGFTGKPLFLASLENRKNSKQMGPVEVIKDRCVVWKFQCSSSLIYVCILKGSGHYW